MKSFKLLWFGGFLYLATVAVAIYFYTEANKYREYCLDTTMSLLQEKPQERNKEYTLEELIQARLQGKIDGKIEALLLVGNEKNNFPAESAESLLEVMREKTKAELENTPQFLNLLTQAAFHQGLSTGKEEAKKEIDANYEMGYHKAMEDLGCPETGKIQMPDMNKPK